MGVEGNTILSTDVQPVDSLAEALLDGVRPCEGVVNTFGLVGDICHNFVISPGVFIPRSDVTLWGDPVAVTPLWCNESSEVPVHFMQGKTMVPVPGIGDSFLLTMWDRPSLVERGLSVVSFSGCM